MRRRAAPPPALRAAFRAARYQVLARPAFSVACGKASPALRRLMSRHQAATAGMVTACNPGARLRPARDNIHAMKKLRRELAALGPLALYPGLNQHPQGRWPDEAAFWILGLSRAGVQKIAVRHKQRALLWCGPSGRPRLLWC